MRVVWRVLVSVFLVAVGSALVASSAVAASPTDFQPLLCPEATPPGCCGPPLAQTAGLQSCCPLPTANCCVATTCAQSLSIAATPDPATSGKTTISGTLTGATVAAQPVVLWQRLAGQSAFSDVGQTQTTSSGGYQFVRSVNTNAKWYVKSGSVTSSTVDEPVLASVALHRSRVRLAAGKKFTLSGSINPSHAGERVALQQLRGRRWVTIVRPKLGAHSSFAVVRKALAPSVERFRVVLAADARNARSVSAVVAITVS